MPPDFIETFVKTAMEDSRRQQLADSGHPNELDKGSYGWSQKPVTASDESIKHAGSAAYTPHRPARASNPQNSR